MHTQKLVETAKKVIADDKGLLAMDESNPTCNKRFAPLGIPQTVEARQAYRQLIITTPGLGESISGLILYDETIRQKKNDGTPSSRSLSMRESFLASKSTSAHWTWPVIHKRKSPKAWTDCATGSMSTFKWARVLPSGAQ